MEGYAAAHHEDAVHAVETGVSVGRANIAEFVSEPFADGIQITFTRHATRLLSPTTASVHGAYEITSGTPPAEGHAILTLVKEGNDWLIAAAQWANASGANASAQSDEEAAINNRIEETYAALNKSDAEGYAAAFQEDAVQAFVANVTVGRANIEKAVSEVLADGEPQIAFTHHATRLLSPTTAIVHGAFEITSDTPPMKGHNLYTLVKEGDEWLIAALQIAPALPEQQ